VAEGAGRHQERLMGVRGPAIVVDGPEHEFRFLQSSRLSFPAPRSRPSTSSYRASPQQSFDLEPRVEGTPQGWHEMAPGIMRRELRPGSAEPRPEIPASALKANSWREPPPPTPPTYYRFATSQGLSFPNPKARSPRSTYRATPHAFYDLYPPVEKPPSAHHEIAPGFVSRPKAAASGGSFIELSQRPASAQMARIRTEGPNHGQTVELTGPPWRGHAAPGNRPATANSFASSAANSVASAQARALIGELEPWLVRKDPELAKALARLRGRVSSLDAGIGS